MVDTASNKLIRSAFVMYSPKIRNIASPSSPIPWSSETSREITFRPHKPVKTPHLYEISSVTVLSLPRDSEIAGWCLRSLLLVQLDRGRKTTVATTWLEGVAEYGTGQDESEAITDLMISLGEYRQSLEKQEEKLGDSAKKELQHLRRLIEPSP